MKLHEKIYYCRKKAGLSQEALAEQLGVSRQAISKWETGDAEPEIGKLRLLATAFGVTTDWLLSEDEPEEESADSQQAAIPSTPGANWVDSIPGALGNLLRRYGWLFGVYIAVGGAGLTVIGALTRYLAKSMFTGFQSDLLYGMEGVFQGGAIYYDQFGNQISSTVSGLAANNPVSIMGAVIMVIGIILIITGVALAVILKNRGSKG